MVSKPSHAKNILPSGQLPANMSKRQSVIDQKLAELQAAKEDEKTVEPDSVNQVAQLNKTIAVNNTKIAELQAEVASKSK